MDYDCAKAHHTEPALASSKLQASSDIYATIPAIERYTAALNTFVLSQKAQQLVSFFMCLMICILLTAQALQELSAATSAYADMLGRRTSRFSRTVDLPQALIAELKSASMVYEAMTAQTDKSIKLSSKALNTTDSVVAAYFTDLACGEKEVMDEVSRICKTSKASHDQRGHLIQSEHYKYFLDEQTTIDRAIVACARSLSKTLCLSIGTSCGDHDRSLSKSGYKMTMKSAKECPRCAKKVRTSIIPQQAVKHVPLKSEIAPHDFTQVRHRSKTTIASSASNKRPEPMARADQWRHSVVHEINVAADQAMSQIQAKQSVNHHTERTPRIDTPIAGDADVQNTPKDITSAEEPAGSDLAVVKRTRFVEAHARKHYNAAALPDLPPIQDNHDPPAVDSCMAAQQKRHSMKRSQSLKGFMQPLLVQAKVKDNRVKTRTRSRAQTMQDESTTSLEIDRRSPPPRNWNTSADLTDMQPRSALQRLLLQPKQHRVMYTTKSPRRAETLMTEPRKVPTKIHHERTRPQPSCETVDEDFAARWYDM